MVSINVSWQRHRPGGFGYGVGIFAYTISGESTPNVLAGNRPKQLTDYGANQLEAVGTAFHYHYVWSSSTSAIQDISPTILYSNEVNVYSTAEQHTIASAQAFMMGLYPPLDKIGMNGTDETANGTTYSSPLGGYQFPKIVSLATSDPDSLAVSGQADCNMYHAAQSEYKNSKEAQEITDVSRNFYLGLWDKVLPAAFDQPSATYVNAIEIADYLDYEYIHNSTASKHITEDDLRQAHYLAGRYSYATNGQGASPLNQSQVGAAAPIAGQTLASAILNTFNANIEESGTQGKMTLLFGNDEPAVALAFLVGLANSHQPGFFSRPLAGASLIFELYSIESNSSYPSYPSSDELFVRFLLHNGTDNSTEFISYPLFGYGPSRTYISWSEFQDELETFAVPSTSDWCLRCNADSAFCNGVLSDDNSPKKQKKGVSPAVAGVIGAAVTLAVVGILGALGFFLCISPRRKDRKPSAGGFKGTTKLASDTDVSFHNPIWRASKTAGTEQQQRPLEVHSREHGHERLGSWEMNEQKIGLHGSPPRTDQAPTPLEDDHEDMEIHSDLQPVRERESV
ncbi:hypothetical protein N7470_008465 [Penicillium chermesinum]|nr:hypothetical protein N7470_008465 [Penicillium chermesinum]